MRGLIRTIVALMLGGIAHISFTALSRPGFADAPFEMLLFGVNTLSIWIVVYFVVPTAIMLSVQPLKRSTKLTAIVGVYAAWFVGVLLFYAYHRQVLDHGVKIWEYSDKWWYLKRNLLSITSCVFAGVGFWLGGKSAANYGGVKCK